MYKKQECNPEKVCDVNRDLYEFCKKESRKFNGMVKKISRKYSKFLCDFLV